MRAVRILLWPAGAALGLAAESALYGWSTPSLWVTDLLAGWSMIACGLSAWSLLPSNRTGPLLAAAGFAWFAGNFASSEIGWVGWLSAQALYLYRGPLVHAVLAYPRGRATGRSVGVAIAAGWLAAAVPAAWRGAATTVALSAALVAVSAAEVARSAGPARRERLAGLEATSFLALVFSGTALARLAAPTAASGRALLATQVALTTLALALLAGLMVRPWRRADVTDLVVDLGERPSGSLAAALGRTLGDPSLRVAYPLADGWVDERGRPAGLPAADDRRAVTRIELEGRTVAVLVHDPAVLDDPALEEEIAVASRLAGAHAVLQAEVLAQIAELEASRRRLLLAADAERRRLGNRLREGAGARLERVDDLLAEARALAPPGAATSVESAELELSRTLAALHELALGLHPEALTRLGLERALAELAAHSRTPVELSIRADLLPDEIAAGLWFVCSEALANVDKYAAATRAVVTVDVAGGAATVEVADDGAGGADAANGSGLRGLADRVEALGGELRVDSPPGGGTRVRAVVPLDQPSG